MTSVPVTPRGTTFARFIKSLAVAKGDVLAAEAYALAQPWRDTPSVAIALKALVDPFTTGDNDAGLRPIALDLSEFLRPSTVVGRISGFRRVPFRCRLIAGTGGAAAAWVGQNQAIPVSTADFSGETGMAPLKVATIVALTAELVKTSGPAADATIAAEVARAIVQTMDSSFIDPSFGAITDERPASVTSGATQLSSSGSTPAQIDADLEDMIGALVAADMPLSTAHWVMHPATATHMSLKRGTGGSPCYPAITAKGGVLAGLPVVTTTACTADGSPSERFVALVEAGEIELADDGGASLEFSEHAALQLNDAPSDTAAQQISLWQANLIAVRGIRFLNWRVRRSGATVVLRDVNY